MYKNLGNIKLVIKKISFIHVYSFSSLREFRIVIETNGILMIGNYVSISSFFFFSFFFIDTGALLVHKFAFLYAIRYSIYASLKIYDVNVGISGKRLETRGCDEGPGRILYRNIIDFSSPAPHAFDPLPDVRALAPLYEAFTCACRNFAAEIVRRFTTTTFVPGQKFIKRVYERRGCEFSVSRKGGGDRGPNRRQTRTDEIDFSRVGGVERDKCDTFNGTRLPKTLEIRKTSLSLSLNVSVRVE